MSQNRENHREVKTLAVASEFHGTASEGIVAIAGSAGSLPVIIQILSQLPASFPLPIIIVKHISPKYPSSLVKILQRNTALSIKEAKNDEKLENSIVYIPPVSYNITITRDRHIRLTAFHKSSQYVCPYANILLHSVAVAYGSGAIAIILTGTGSDGTEGIKAIRDRQGIIIIQNEATSEFIGMPHAAIAAQVAQYVVPQTEIAATLTRVVQQPHHRPSFVFNNPEITMSDRDEDQALESLLDYLRRVRGFDFTGYKRPSLRRRILKRMQVHQIESFEGYWDYLQVHPEEFQILFNTILINVTGFFRDTDTWTFLREQVIPDILQEKNATAPIRIWTAGCASGEESYSIGMLLCEELGLETFHNRVKIYATDIDQEALSQARQAVYTPQEIENIPDELQTKYLEPLPNNCYTFRNEIRRATIFGRHNLIDDAPISRLDLLICRNTLMYFDAETQTRILARFHFALNDNSALFLGKAEMLLGHTRLFTPISLQHRIFRKVTSVNPRHRILALSSTNDPEISDSLTLDT